MEEAKMDNLEEILEHLDSDQTGDDEIRKENFSLGLPIYYYSDGNVIKEDPDGRKWVVDMDENKKEIIVQELH